jgi:hypothetical protein
MKTMFSKLFTCRCITFFLFLTTASFSQIPTDSLQLWLNSDVGVTLNGSTVSQWADQSGNGNHVIQTTANRQPLYVPNGLNAHPIIRFDGVNDKLGFTGSTPMSQISVFFIVKNDSDATSPHNDLLIFGPANGGMGEQYFILFRGLANVPYRIGLGLTFTDGIRAEDPGIATYGEWRLISLITNQSIHNTTLRWGGESTMMEDATMLPVGSNIAISVSLGDATGSGGGIGGADGVPAGSIFARCDFAEVIVYNRVVSEIERSQIEQYLSQKFNLATPVELVSFNSTIIGHDIQLNWQTASEINNQGFEIYRNGNKIAFVDGKGTTTETQDYTFVDKNLQPGIYNFRLNQLDFDGTQEVVGELTVYLTLPEQFSLEQNYPNPFNPSTTIRYSIPASLNPSNGGTLVILKVYDLLGREMTTLVNKEQTAGVYEIEFDAGELSSGIYVYQLRAGNLIQSKKMVLIR